MTRETASAYLNLLKTVVGGALVQYPSLFVRHGVVPTMALSAASAFAAYLGLVLYVELNRKTGDRSSISSLSRHCVPWMEAFVNLVIFLKCCLVVMVYIKYLDGMLRNILGFLLDIEETAVPLRILLASVTPITFITDIALLQPFSFLGIVSTALMVFLSFHRLLGGRGSLEIAPRPQGYTSDLGVFVFSYTCHQNIFPVQNRMGSAGLQSLKSVLVAVLGTSFAIYSAFGIASGLAFGHCTRENVLETACRDTGMLFMNVFYSIALALTIPLQINPCVHYGLSVFGTEYAVSRKFRYLRWASSSALMLLIYVAFCYSGSARSILNLVGSLFSSLINLAFPGIYYLTFRGLERTPGLTCSALAVLSVSVFNVVCLAANELLPRKAASPG